MTPRSLNILFTLTLLSMFIFFPCLEQSLRPREEIPSSLLIATIVSGLFTLTGFVILIRNR